METVSLVKDRLRSRMAKAGAAAALFAMTAVILTWPLVTDIGTLTPSLNRSQSGSDSYFFMWYINTATKTLTNDLPVPAGQMVFYPQGVNLMNGYDSPLTLGVAVALNLALGNPVVAYNLVILLGFVLTAFGMYCFLRYWIGSYGWALFGGLVFGFSVYTLTRGISQMNLMMLGVVPLQVLASLKFFRNPSPKSAVLLSFAMLLTALSSWYYALGGLVFLVLSYVYFFRELWGRKWVAAAGIVGVALALFIPALPLVFSGGLAGLPMADQYKYENSAILINYFVPVPLSIFGRFTMSAYRAFSHTSFPDHNELTSYLGLLGIFSLLPIVLRGRIKVPLLNLWTVILLVFSVLSLGPYWLLFGRKIYLPFYLLNKVYPFQLFRVPNRFFVFALLASTVLAIHALIYLTERFKAGRVRWGIAIILALVLLSERLFFPYPMGTTPMIPPFYREAARDPASFVIADLPIYDGTLYDYYQIVHGKPLSFGMYYYPAINRKTYQSLLDDPLMSHGFCEDDTRPLDVVPGIDEEYARLRSQGVRYVVVHNLILKSDEKCGTADRNIRAFFKGQKPYFNDGEITVYYTGKPE